MQAVSIGAQALCPLRVTRVSHSGSYARRPRRILTVESHGGRVSSLRHSHRIVFIT